ncbi:MAG: polysaccharide biosynthesis/export family protein [Sulfitobacter sp.]
MKERLYKMGTTIMGTSVKPLIGIFLSLALAACGTLPRGAALQSEIVKNEDSETADFSVYPVTKAFLPVVADWPETGVQRHGWIGKSAGAKTQIIQPGDILDVLIWDSGENSLLTSPGQRVADLSGMRVSQAGTIFVPYVGKIKVSGRSPDSARHLVQRQLEDIVPAAQVQLRMTEGRTNSVDLIGGVGSAGPVIMPDQDFTVLSALSAAGGVSGGMENPQVKLVRGSKIYSTSVDRLYENPALDTRLQGGDKVIVEEDRRYFLSLGASGQEAQFTFNRDKVTALDALSIIGGVNDTRANPKGVLVLREYPSNAVRADQSGPEHTRAVFTIDLTSSDGLFSARNFEIHSGDLVLATESAVANTRTILSLVGSAFGVVNIATN